MRPPRPALRALALPLGAWLVSRGVLLVAVAVGAALSGSDQTVVSALHLWDGNWYLSAAEGYGSPSPALPSLPQSNIAFFPVYPLAIRAVAALPGVTPLGTAVALNLAAGAVAVCLIWWLVATYADRAAADRAALLLCAFPGSIVLTMVYSEPLMLCFAAGCLLALGDRRWALAGALAALAGASRPTGVVLAGCCAWAAVGALRRERDWSALVAPALAPLGFLAYLAWLWWRSGEPLIWLRVQQEGWGERIDFGRRTAAEVAAVVADPGGVQLGVLLQVAGLAFVVAGLVALARWRPPAPVTLYAVGVIVLVTMSATLGARPRFVLTAFPLVAAVAWAVRGKAFAVLLAISGVASVWLAAVYTIPGVAVP